MATSLLLLLFLCCVPFLLLILFLRRRPSSFTVAFFHPYADAGGGGERVLWHVVSTMIDKWPSARYTIITGDKDRTPAQILTKVKNRFGITIREGRVTFVYLRLRFLIEASTWPRFTLAGQILGSMLLGVEAMIHCRPHLFFDTMGYAFTYPLFKWLTGCMVASYVHYPIVSTDMLRLVASGQASYNNRSGITRSRFLTNLKIRYYRLLAMLYGFVGRRSNVVMVNSSWTYGHIKDIWRSRNVSILYPPCDCKAFLDVPSKRLPDECRMVSIGQFRPEKDHKKQIDTVKALLDNWSGNETIKLSLIGSCRDAGDHERVESLKKYCKEMEVSEYVDFLINVSFDRLQDELGRSLIALHTMWNEHFGIGIVECMASGCIMIAHRSGGPLMDIVTEFNGRQTGFLAETADQFADRVIEVLSMNEEERDIMIKSAKASITNRFSVETFQNNLIARIEPIMKLK